MKMTFESITELLLINLNGVDNPEIEYSKHRRISISKEKTMSVSQYSVTNSQTATRTLLKNVYLWMTAGLSLTAAVAWWTASSPAVLELLFGRGPFLFYGLIIGEFILVLSISSRIMNMSVMAAVGSFIAYSMLNGLTISVILLAYTGTAVFQAFVSSAAMFGAMSLWAVTTKRDLSGWGHYLFMGLIGLIIAGLVGIFIGGRAYHLLYSGVGVILFTLLTAYDTQMIKKMSHQVSASVGEDDFIRLSILGALKLYLDFINMFLFLLRLFGRQR